MRNCTMPFHKERNSAQTYEACLVPSARHVQKGRLVVALESK